MNEMKSLLLYQLYLLRLLLIEEVIINPEVVDEEENG